MINDTVYKFDQEGKPLPYYGNTIISFLNKDKWPIFNEAVKIQDALKDSVFAEWLSFLPTSSLHMTVLTLCREIDRGTKYWPPQIRTDDCFHEIDEALKKIVGMISRVEHIMMEVDYCEVTKIVLKPYRKEDEKKLTDYRNKIAEATGIRHPWHDGFRYHISLDYKIKELDKYQKAVSNELCRELTKRLKKCVMPFKIPAPEFVIFNDMMSYETDLSKRGDLY